MFCWRFFADLHPGLIDENRSITSIFTPQSAREFLVQIFLDGLTSLLNFDADTFEEIFGEAAIADQPGWKRCAMSC